MLEYENACFSYGPHQPGEGRGKTGHVRDVTLSFQPRDFALLMGENGSGKSTLLRMANGLIPHFHTGEFRGRVIVEGDDTREHPVRELSRKVGVVFQNQEAQLFNSTVERELAFGPRNLGLGRDEIRNRIHRAAERTGIAQLQTKPTQELASGEAAKVAIACVLAMEPPLLVLDEPFSALDPVSALEIQELLAELNESGITVVVAEHRSEGLWAHIKSAAAMRDGGLAFCGRPEDAMCEQLMALGLPIPSLARMFEESGLPERPFTVEQAVDVLRSRNLSMRTCAEWRPAPGESLLDAQGICYSRREHPVIRSVGLQLRRGEVAALVGSNGAGKTTLLRLLAGLIHPAKGKITDGNGLQLQPSQIGVLFQNANDSLFCRTIREEVEYSAKMFHRYDPDWLGFLFELFDLAMLLDRSPLSLSEGEKRRVALAATLAHRPQVVLLDEPTVGQDNRRRDALVKMLHCLQAEGVGVLMATHDLEFAASHCPRWLVLSDGELLADTTSAEVMGNPTLMASASLLPTPVARLAARLGVQYAGERAMLVPNRVEVGG